MTIQNIKCLSKVYDKITAVIKLNPNHISIERVLQKDWYKSSSGQ